MLALTLTGVRTDSTVAFVNGHFITMDANRLVVQAMLVQGGRISELGSTRAIVDKISASTRVVDLQGQIVIPGIVDAHSHFPAAGIRSVSVDLSPPPIGATNTLQKLLDQIASASAQSRKKDWVLGFNYDNTSLPDGLHPTREQLDAVAPDHPVYLWHSSGHMGVANSAALARLSIDEKTAVSADGFIGRDKKTGLLNGLLQESAAPALANIVDKFSLPTQWRVLTAARDDYLANGVTTIQNGYAGLNMMRLLQAAQWLKVIPQRIVVWPAHNKESIADKFSQRRNNKTHANFNFRVGAIKILVDGSPQGLTAYLSKPYFNAHGKARDYRGFSLLEQHALIDIVSRYHANGYQLALHGNGDEAIEYIINAVESAQKNQPRSDARHIIVHAQTIRRDQLERLMELSLTPSFFVSHTYFWGDWHRKESLGPVRAANISPTQWAEQFGLRYSLHTDAPVTPMNPMQLLWSATNRKSTSGYLLGPNQRIDIHAALQAITIDAAWQSHIDDTVGSFEIGKAADMAVLSENPYSADDLRQIQVLETYISGVTRYSLAEGVAGD